MVGWFRRADLRPRPKAGASRIGILSRGAIRRGSFGSVKELIAKIDLFAASWNAGASPFAWVKTADEILAKAVRKPVATNESGH